MEPEHQFMGVVEVATVLRLNPKTVEKWVTNGRVRAYGTRGGYRLRFEEVLEAMRVKPKRLGKPLNWAKAEKRPSSVVRISTGEDHDHGSTDATPSDDV
jgi:excisionase family DNA binding protein